ncbi:hypothetical protein AB1N83_013407 [Pleurotus pulmonarius]
MWSRVLVRCLLWTATVSSSQIQDSKSHTKASAAVATQYSTYDPWRQDTALRLMPPNYYRMLRFRQLRIALHPTPVADVTRNFNSLGPQTRIPFRVF